MKNSSTCPKCGSDDIIRIEGDGENRIQVGWTILGVVPVTRYVCAGCGFSEEYVEADHDIEALKRKFQRQR